MYAIYMGDFTDVVRNAIEFYDDNEYKNASLIKKFKYYAVPQDSNRIMFYDKDKQKIYDAPCECIGAFMEPVWIWAWCMPTLRRVSRLKSQNVLKYALNLSDNNAQENLLRIELVTSRHRVTSNIQVVMHVALTAFLAKEPFVIKIPILNEMSNDVVLIPMSPPKDQIFGYQYLMLMNE